MTGHTLPIMEALGYREVAAQLRAQIRSGKLAAGQVLPSEATLMQRHGVSRPTVRRAVAALRDEGLVVTRHGYGTYVRDERGLEPVEVGHGVVTARMPTIEERQELGVPVGVPVLVWSRPGVEDRVMPADRLYVEVRAPGPTV